MTEYNLVSRVGFQMDIKNKEISTATVKKTVLVKRLLFNEQIKTNLKIR